MKIRLLRDLYRCTDQNVRLVFAKAGDILESHPFENRVDWLVGCRTAKLVHPLDEEDICFLGEGYDFEVVFSENASAVFIQDSTGTVTLKMQQPSLVV